MTEIVIRITRHDFTREDLASGRAQLAMRDALFDAIPGAMHPVRRTLSTGSPRKSGDLKGSYLIAVAQTGPRTIRARIGSPLRYAQIIERGGVGKKHPARGFALRALRPMISSVARSIARDLSR